MERNDEKGRVTKVNNSQEKHQKREIANTTGQCDITGCTTCVWP